MNASSAFALDSFAAAVRALKPRPVAMRGLLAPHIVCVHVDGFFASVEQAMQARLADKPVVVVGREQVVSASYEARLLGVRTGMTTTEVLEHGPKARVVQGRYPAYAEYAERVRRILESFSPAVDADPHHGFYLDLFGSPWLTDYPAALRRLQLEILKGTGLSLSIGAARTRVVAAVAARVERPRGIRVVAPGSEDAFLASLPVEVLHGICGVDAGRLSKRGVSTIGKLRRVPRVALEAAYGDMPGRQVWESARGRDWALRDKAKPGELSREVIVDPGTMDPEYLSALTEYLSERLLCVLRDTVRRAERIALRIRYVDRFTISQSLRLAGAANGENHWAAARRLLRSVHTRRKAVHSLRLSVESLDLQSTGDSCLPPGGRLPRLAFA